MTFTTARNMVRQLGLTLTRRPGGEYRVNLPNGKEATAHYTNDLEDAVATARATWKQQHRNSYIA